VELGEVIKLDASRKLQATSGKRQAAGDKQQAPWDKPLTTDFESDRKRQLESRDKALETSHEKRGLVLGFHHKVFHS
jgi:hypothetical protein